MTCDLAAPFLCRFLTPEWQTAFWTAAVCITALLIALFGKRMEHWFYHPDLELVAEVKLPNSQRVGRYLLAYGATPKFVGETWFFRLAVKNNGRAPARNVQVFLEKVEKIDGTNVDRFSPMNLRWANTGATTRELLLRDLTVFCDFIHIGDPAFRRDSGDDLDTVVLGKGVMYLDVEATSSAKAHLLEPGAYRFHLKLAAENFDVRAYTVGVRYTGDWYLDQGQMFDEETGFRMKKL